MNSENDSSDEPKGANQKTLSAGESSPPQIVQQSLKSSSQTPTFQENVDSTPSHNPANDEERGDMNGIDHQMLIWTRVNAMFVGATLAAILLTAIVFWGQWNEMAHQTDLLNIAARQARRDSAEAAITTQRQILIAQQQAKAAQDGTKAIQRQMRQDQRAWLDISFGDLQHVEKQPLSIPVTVTNVGKTAAKNYEIDVVIRLIRNTKQGGDSIRFVYNFPHIHDSSGYITPNEPVKFIATSARLASDHKTVQSEEISHDDTVAFLQDGTKFAIIYAKARYRDVFGVEHWIKVCKFASHSTNTFAYKCTHYSDVDNN